MLINKQEQYTGERYNKATGTAKTFMSNLYQLSYPILVDEWKLEFYNSEGYYMALRTDIYAIRLKIAQDSSISGQESRKARKRYILEQDEQKRAQYMQMAVKAKFDANKDLRDILLTVPGEIIEKNYWKDDLFGVREDTLQGANILGKCLMEYRDNYLKQYQ